MSDAVKDSTIEIQYPPSILDDVNKLVQRVQTFTGASGAAIALREGEEMVCRASRGNNAPDVGMMMNLDGTFTGLAVTGMKAVRCDDAENDPRVDPEVSRALHIKSMAVVPVLSGMRVTGVIATFSAQGSAFSDTHMAVLKTMADGLGANILRWTESQGIAIPVPSSKPAAPPVKVITVPVEAPKPANVVEFKPKGEPAAAPTAQATAAAAAPAPEKKEKKSDPKLQGKWKPVAPPKEEEAPAAETKPAPKAEPKPEAKPQAKAQPAAAPSFSYAPTEETEGKKSPMLFVGIGAAVLVAAVGGYFMFGHSSKPAAPASTTTTSAPAPATPATTTPVATTNTTAAATSKPEAVKPSSQNATEKKPTQIADTTTTLKPAPAPMVVASTPAKATPKAAVDDAPPSLNIAGATGPALDVPFNTSAPKLSTPPPANAVIVPSRLVQRVNPIYPQSAKQYRIEGAVSLSATIGPDGRVKEAKVLSGPPLLRDSAVTAVRQWKYAPSTVNGRAVESSVNIVLQFKMP